PRGFECEDVGFPYPGSERWAVRHLSFALPPGERLALVGENGAGKTTLVKLLARLYDPDEGRILLDGVDLREFDLASLRKNIGVIFQDFVRYDFIMKENIGVSQVEQLDDDARIREAARRSRADAVATGLGAGGAGDARGAAGTRRAVRRVVQRAGGGVPLTPGILAWGGGYHDGAVQRAIPVEGSGLRRREIPGNQDGGHGDLAQRGDAALGHAVHDDEEISPSAHHRRAAAEPVGAQVLQ